MRHLEIRSNIRGAPSKKTRQTSPEHGSKSTMQGAKDRTWRLHAAASYRDKTPHTSFHASQGTIRWKRARTKYHPEIRLANSP